MQKIKSRKYLLEQLNEFVRQSKGNGDLESIHSQADELLINYIGDDEIKKAYEEIDKWYA